jgi:hypothetical protein
MEFTTRELWTLLHGMGFGALYLLAFSGALVELGLRYASRSGASITLDDERFLKIYLTMMAVLAWLAVLTGTYLIYPWYRAVPPAGTVNLADFPQRLLQSNAATSAWHSIGMEWKEHVGWLAPIAATMAAAVSIKYGRDLKSHPQLRNAVLCFALVAFLAAGIAGFFGAMLDKHAPVQGGSAIRLFQGESR